MPDEVAASNIDNILQQIASHDTDASTNNGADKVEETGGAQTATLSNAPTNQSTERNQTLAVPNRPQDTRANDDVDATAQAKASQFRIARVDGKLRLVDLEGNLVHDPDFERKVITAMEEHTQKSSMSLTQENPESAYEQFNIQNLMMVEAGEDSEDGERSTNYATARDSLLRQHMSTRTDSTAHTYGEDDTGHVNFDFIPGLPNGEIDKNASQDASYAAPPVEHQSHGQSYDPQTPAPPINPFSQKGSVLKGFEMFGATQPSSIGRHVASPTSSRPSPDVYNDFTSPPQKRMLSSPLVRRVDGDETSPLQSSVRDLLRPLATDSPLPASAPLIAGVKSFDRGSRFLQTSSIREPRSYVSMKASQERRRKETSSVPPDSDAESSDSDIDDIRRKRQRKIEREQNILKELSTIELHKRPPMSSRPEAASSGLVEVPSTSRRHSLPEDYIAQCTGQDARDTQQDDMVADSQNMLDNNEPRELDGAEDNLKDYASPRADVGQNDGPSQTIPSPTLPGRPNLLTEGELDFERGPAPTEKTGSNPEGSGTESNQPSLPLQEVSSNRNELRTPVAGKTPIFSDGADTTVPETSPPEARLRPMTEIATISFGQETEDDMLNNLPGFTQDVEFERAMRITSPPEPPRLRFQGDRHTTTDAVAVSAEPVDVPKPPTQLTASQIPLPESADRESGTVNINISKNDKDTNEAGESAVGDVEKRTKTSKKPSQTSTQTPRGLRSQSQLKGPSASLRRSAITTIPNASAVPRNSSRGLKSTTTAKLVGAWSPTRLSTTSVTASTPLSTPHTPAANSAEARSARRPSTRQSAGKAVPEESTSIPAPTEQNTITNTHTARVSVRKSGNKPVAEKMQASTSDSTSNLSASRSSKLLSASKAANEKEQTTAPPAGKRSLKRKSGPILVDDAEEAALPARSSKPKSTGHINSDSSDDPLALLAHSTITVSRNKERSWGIFNDMAFAVSYVKQQSEKENVSTLITEHGGRILDDGFDSLFEDGTPSKLRAQHGDVDSELKISPAATSIGFTALIADEHSRKAKYMQALALGIPCISGYWISACVTKDVLIDWAPYLLCAGQSSYLGNAIRSRILQPYSAIDASFPETFSTRDKLLDGKSILLVNGKGKAGEKRKAYVFLTRAMGPSRLGQVVDLAEAKKKLLDSEAGDNDWDLLYVENDVNKAAAAVFGFSSAANSGRSKKRKRSFNAGDENLEQTPKKIRVISDEVVIQSLILGQLLDE
jgi:hypothetical protein